MCRAGWGYARGLLNRKGSCQRGCTRHARSLIRREWLQRWRIARCKRTCRSGLCPTCWTSRGTLGGQGGSRWLEASREREGGREPTREHLKKRDRPGSRCRATCLIHVTVRTCRVRPGGTCRRSAGPDPWAIHLPAAKGRSPGNSRGKVPRRDERPESSSPPAVGRAAPVACVSRHLALGLALRGGDGFGR